MYYYTKIKEAAYPWQKRSQEAKPSITCERINQD
jgi:hypothetical protein